MLSFTASVTHIITKHGKFFKSLILCSLNNDLFPFSGQTKDYEIGICCYSAKACSIKGKELRLVGSESG